MLLHQVAVCLLSMAAGGGALCRQGAGGMNWAGVGQHLAGGVGVGQGGEEGQEEQELEYVVDITEYLNSLCFVTFCMCVCMLAMLLLSTDGCCISFLNMGEMRSL